ncbi:ABC transporter ATP-binding protein [Salinarimonas ramus]|uniref:ABC transporter ATP-binding protein n=1 Tax=Salinarimonas ramus TaxID=690164 RepID=A0A917V2C6_9HYPH|nr:ABC transporter ATP-binding protein [Salinarimonas ramus]GGK20695.1 ABC transporter ATP-binding protein [Salinarimonas ramus]
MTAALSPVEPPLLEIDALSVTFDTRAGPVEALRSVSLVVEAGETLGLVGESGCGKSVTAQAVMGLVDVPGRISGGDVRWRGRSLVDPRNARFARSLRGREIGMVFQDPMTSLNPLMPIGAQIGEVLTRHLGLTKAQARARAVDLLAAVGIGAPRTRVDLHPHEMSGGMRQRVMIAMAIACEPALVLADEPTTALDVTVQAQILDLLADLQQRLGIAIVLVSHDLGVVAGLCHRVAVMYAGQVVESAGVEDLFARPAHPYTQGLLRSAPRLDDAPERLVGIEGAPPSLLDPPQGCGFLARCPIGDAACAVPPPARPVGPGRLAACVRPFTPAWGDDRSVIDERAEARR